MGLMAVHRSDARKPDLIYSQSQETLMSDKRTKGNSITTMNIVLTIELKQLKTRLDIVARKRSRVEV